MHERKVNKSARNRKRSLMSGLNPCDHDLLQPATKRPGCIAVNEIYEFECRDSQEMHTMTKVIQTFTKTLNVVLNMYVLAVINYGIRHLSREM